MKPLKDLKIPIKDTIIRYPNAQACSADQKRYREKARPKVEKYRQFLKKKSLQKK